LTTIPAETKQLLDVDAKESELVQLLINDTRNVIERLNILTRELIALALLIFKNGHCLLEDVEEFYNMYEALTGEHFPELNFAS